MIALTFYAIVEKVIKSNERTSDNKNKHDCSNYESGLLHVDAMLGEMREQLVRLSLMPALSRIFGSCKGLLSTSGRAGRQSTVVL